MPSFYALMSVCGSTNFVQTEISQLSNGLTCNFAQAFMILRGLILQMFGDPLTQVKLKFKLYDQIPTKLTTFPSGKCQ